MVLKEYFKLLKTMFYDHSTGKDEFSIRGSNHTVSWVLIAESLIKVGLEKTSTENRNESAGYGEQRRRGVSNPSKEASDRSEWAKNSLTTKEMVVRGTKKVRT